MNRLFNGKERLGDVLLHRTGDQVEILRPEGTATENQYGKIEDGDRTFDVVARETARRVYDNVSDRPGEADVTGGRLDTENPRILFQKSTAAVEGDRVTFPDDETYYLDEEVPLETHTSFRVTVVNG